MVKVFYQGRNLTFCTTFKSRVMGFVTMAHCYQVILERGLKLRGIKQIKYFMAFAETATDPGCFV